MKKTLLILCLLFTCTQLQATTKTTAKKATIKQK